MAHYRNFPIWTTALELAVQLKHAVRGLPRCHKYTLGTELLQISRRLCRGAANVENASLKACLIALDLLVLAVNEMKMLLTLAQEMRTVGIFNKFARPIELAIELAVTLCRKGWTRSCRDTLVFCGAPTV